MMQIYVKATSNCDGLPLQSFEELSLTWRGESLDLPFGEGEERKVLTVVGWTDLFGGRPCEVKVTKVRWLPYPEEARQALGGPAEPQEGYLVWGGNAGVRILDEEAEPIPGVDDHLPRGYGWPIIWVEDIEDLPSEVREVVERPLEEGR